MPLPTPEDAMECEGALIYKGRVLEDLTRDELLEACRTAVKRLLLIREKAELATRLLLELQQDPLRKERRDA